MGADRDVEIVRHALESIGRLDIDAALELVTDDLVLELPFRGDGGPRRMVGDDAKAFMRAMPKLFSELPFLDLQVHGRLPSGQIVVEYRSEGVTHAGRAYPNRYAAFFELRGDRISVWREYFDPTVVSAAFPPA
ncbi:MAG TPA: nuclear transport factor 2 family protein [Acidimicrobiia bacterium]|nr:nuclear transport factor 2 family protein [Acidimicrobiia bacterium]